MAVELLPEAAASARFPELRGVYAGLRAIQDRARVMLCGAAERVASYLHQVRLSFVQRLDKACRWSKLDRLPGRPGGRAR